MKCRKGWLTVGAVAGGVVLGAGVLAALWPDRMAVCTQPVAELPVVAEHVSLQEVLLTEACTQAEAALALLRGVNDTFTAEASAARYVQCWAEVRVLGALWGECGAGDEATETEATVALKNKLGQLGSDLQAEKQRLMAPEVDAYGSEALQKALRGELPPVGLDADGVELLVADTAALARDMAAGAPLQREDYARCMKLRVRWAQLAAQGGVMLTLAEQMCRAQDGELMLALESLRKARNEQELVSLLPPQVSALAR